jgi:hypothetical protein
MSLKRAPDVDLESPSKRKQRDTLYITTLARTAAITRPFQERSTVYGETSFVNPILQHLPLTATPAPLNIPFVPWMLIGNIGLRLLYRPAPFYLTGGLHPPLRMLTFGALGSGRVQSMEQKFLALMSIMLFASNKCKRQPFYGAWKGQRTKVDDGVFRLPPKIGKYVWRSAVKEPYQTDIYNPYYVKPTKVQQSSLLCMSKMHLGVRTTQTTPVASFMFMVPMCESCFVANCHGISNTVTALLKQKSPWRAVDALAWINQEHTPTLKPILKSLKRVHMIAGLDSNAPIDLFLSADDSNVHGTLVSHLFYYFPDVYSVREHAFAIDQTSPMLGFGKYTAMSGRFCVRNRRLVLKYRETALLHAGLFANYGRANVDCGELLLHADFTKSMLPFVSFKTAAESGVYPYHVFVYNENMFYTTVFVRVWRALLSGYLKLTVLLAPPCDLSALKHVDSSNDTKKKTRVQDMPELRWLDSAPEKTYCCIGNRPHMFYGGEFLTYEWLASVLDLYEHASAVRQVPTPPSISFTISGSYYRAACGQTVLNREAATCFENIVVGGCFAELVEIAVSPTKRTLLPETAVTVAMHDDVCDVVQYADELFDGEALSKELVFGVLRAEHSAMKADGQIQQAVTAFCDKVEIPSPCDSVRADKPDTLDVEFVHSVLKLKEHFLSDDLLGTSAVVAERLCAAVHNRHIETLQAQALPKKK